MDAMNPVSRKLRQVVVRRANMRVIIYEEYSAFRSHRESSPWSPYAMKISKFRVRTAVRPAVNSTSDIFQVLTALAD